MLNGAHPSRQGCHQVVTPPPVAQVPLVFLFHAPPALCGTSGAHTVVSGRSPDRLSPTNDSLSPPSPLDRSDGVGAAEHVGAPSSVVVSREAVSTIDAGSEDLLGLLVDTMLSDSVSQAKRCDGPSRQCRRERRFAAPLHACVIIMPDVTLFEMTGVPDSRRPRPPPRPAGVVDHQAGNEGDDHRQPRQCHVSRRLLASASSRRSVASHLSLRVAGTAATG